MGFLVGLASKVAGPRVLLGVVGVGIAMIITLGGLLYWNIQRNGALSEQRDQAVAAAKNNAEQVDKLRADIARRDDLDAAFDAALDRIEVRFDGLSQGIQQAVAEADEAYLACRRVPAPDGVYQRLLDGARGTDRTD